MVVFVTYWLDNSFAQLIRLERKVRFHDARYDKFIYVPKASTLLDSDALIVFFRG